MNAKLSLRVVVMAVVACVCLESAAGDLSARWVARVPNGDGTFRETVFALDQEGSTLTGSVINPTNEQPIVDGRVEGNAFTFAVAPANNPQNRTG